MDGEQKWMQGERGEPLLIVMQGNTLACSGVRFMDSH